MPLDIHQRADNTIMNYFNCLRLPFIATTLVIATLTSTVHAADTRSERLWLPASASNLRPFLQMAVDLALTDEDCADVLYARLNEYRTIYEEPTFTILCKRNAKSTFNRVIPITEVDPDYFAKLEAGQEALDTARNLSSDINAIRQQLLNSSPTPTTPTTAPAPAAPIQEDPEDMTLDLSTPTTPEN